MAGRIGRRLSDSTPSYFSYPSPRAGAPNVVMIVLDDVGFAQLGCFGAGIDTPNIDRLAAGGLRYNRFHVTSICSSTRACLLTGRNHHAVGVGLTQESTLGFPGYTGRIPKSAATLARLLRDTGYNALAVGKWHLAHSSEYSAAGPMDRWPLGLGFERYYGFLGAETSQWAPELVRDNSHIETPRTPAEGYHLTEDLTDQAIRMILDQQQAAPGKPFFCYFATGAAHAPHHVAPEWVEPYRGRFDAGWEHYRAEAFARQVAEGIVPAGTRLTERPPWVPEWAGLSADERRVYARYMEVFAGFMTHTDAQIGRLIGFLTARGLLDNTLVFLLSDNGASAEGTIKGNFNEATATHNITQDIAEAVARIDDIGGPTMFNHYPWSWAWAGNTPLQLWKRYAWLGGTRTPLIVHWPAGIADRGAVRGQFTHAIDVLPTVLDVVGVSPPESVDGVTQQRIDGASMAATFTDAQAAEFHPQQYFEMHGSRSMYADGWKATTNFVAAMFGEREFIPGSDDADRDHWALFDLTSDFAEATDVSDEHPERARALEQLWWAEAGRNQVLPLFEGMASQLAAHQPNAWPPPVAAEYIPGGGPIGGSQLPNMMGGFTIEADLDVDAGGQGIVCALGDLNGGFGVYLLDGRPVAHFELLGEQCHVVAADPLPAGRHTLRMTYAVEMGSMAPGTGVLTRGDAKGTVTLTVGDTDVGSGTLPGLFMLHGVITTGVGLLIGRDRGVPLCDDYQPPFPFTGTLHKVVMRSSRPVLRPDPQHEFEVAQRRD